MGDTISIRFVNGDDKSVVLFSHWGGQSFFEEAKKYVEELRIEIAHILHIETNPLERLEPQTVMVDFIRHITLNKERIMSDLYLGADEFEGDNSDNGHYDINLATGEKVIVR